MVTISVDRQHYR